MTYSAPIFIDQHPLASVIRQAATALVNSPDEARDVLLAGLEATKPVLPNARRYAWRTALEAVTLPPPAWLVRDLLVMDTVSMLYGPSRSFKSFAVLDLAGRIATGMEWHEKRVRRHPVLYVAAEGASGLGFRLKAWARQHRVDPSTLDVQFITEPINLADAEAVGAFINDLKLSGYERPVIIFDTLSACAAGVDEDKAGTMTGIIGALTRIRVAVHAATVLVIHHTGKDASRGARGSYALKANLDAMIECSREANSMSAKLRVEKQKDGPDDIDFHFRAVEVEVDVVPGEGVRTGLVAMQAQKPDDPERFATGDAEARFTLACIAHVGKASSLSGLVKCAGIGWGGGIQTKFERAFPVGQSFEVETPSGVRVLTRKLVDGKLLVVCHLPPNDED